MKRLLLAAALLLPGIAFADAQRPAGATSQCFGVFISDSSSTTGAGLTGLAYNTGSLTCYYYRQNAGTGPTAITLASSTLGTYTSGAFKEISSTNAPGWYEFCPPDAALAAAAGVNEVVFQCKGASNMAPMNLRVNLIGASSFGYDGKLASESGTTLGLASAAVDADDQFNDGFAIVVYDSAGLISAKSCITDSTNTGDTITTYADISSLVAVNDNYIIQPDAGCSANVAKWFGTAIPAVHSSGYPIVTIKDGTGTGEIDTTSGSVSGAGGGGSTIRKW